MHATALRLSRSANIGWIGLGAMGAPMALNLFTKTHRAMEQAAAGQAGEDPKYLFCEQSDANADRFMDAVRDKGGAELARRVKRVGTPGEIALNAGRILSMLPSTPQVRSVYLDPSTGILPALVSLSSSSTPVLPPPTAPDVPVDPVAHPPTASSSDREAPASASAPSGDSRPHTLLIDGTTLDPTAAVEIATMVRDQTGGRAMMVDAPVSGGVVAATAGTLTIMFGSPSPLATEHAVPLLARMAREGGVVACGGNGTGVGVKVCNNLILAINQIGLAEGLALGRSLGIDPLLLHNVINTSSGQSWSSKVNSPLPEVDSSPGSRGYKGGFLAKLMLKDVGLALSAAHAHDLPLPLGWASRSVYEAVCAEGEGEMAEQDFSVVLEWLRRKQAQGVERGWKDGGPGSTASS